MTRPRGKKVYNMLTFARNKLVAVTAKDRDTLSIHAILDDDIYGLEVDLCVGVENREILSISGKWNRRTTPECERAIPFLQEIKGDRMDEKIGDRLNKVLGRKGCRHFANLLIECCHAATQAARVVRWEEARVARPALSFESFLKERARGQNDMREEVLSPQETRVLPPSPPRVETAGGPREPAGPGSPQREGRRQGFVIDLHAHSFPASSCSSSSADKLIEEAKRIGLGGICLTDHNHLWTSGRIEELRQKHRFPVFGGSEITTSQGDMLVFGLDKNIEGILTLEELRDEVVKTGGFMIAAHPFRGFLAFKHR